MKTSPTSLSQNLLHLCLERRHQLCPAQSDRLGHCSLLTGEWRMKEIYTYAYSPLCALILLLGLLGKLPRVGPSTSGAKEMRDAIFMALYGRSPFPRRFCWIVWKLLPSAVGPTQVGSQIKFLVFASSLLIMGLIAWRGRLPRTRPIVPGEVMVSGTKAQILWVWVVRSHFGVI